MLPCHKNNASSFPPQFSDNSFMSSFPKKSNSSYTLFLSSDFLITSPPCNFLPTLSSRPLPLDYLPWHLPKSRPDLPVGYLYRQWHWKNPVPDGGKWLRKTSCMTSHFNFNFRSRTCSFPFHFSIPSFTTYSFYFGSTIWSTTPVTSSFRPISTP